jgi:hypothetical protein
VKNQGDGGDHSHQEQARARCTSGEGGVQSLHVNLRLGRSARKMKPPKGWVDSHFWGALWGVLKFDNPAPQPNHRGMRAVFCS